MAPDNDDTLFTVCSFSRGDLFPTTFRFQILFFVCRFPFFSSVREILAASTATEKKGEKEGAALPFFISTFLGIVKPKSRKQVKLS